MNIDDAFARYLWETPALSRTVVGLTKTVYRLNPGMGLRESHRAVRAWLRVNPEYRHMLRGMLGWDAS